MTELIKIEDFNGEKTCNARELHSFLEVKTRFNDWINNRINKYSFVENIDYAVVTKKLVTEGKDYYISLDMAKQLSMVENNGKGQEARIYFIACEKHLKEELSKQAIPVDYDLIGKIVGVAVCSAIKELRKEDKIELKTTPKKEKELTDMDVVNLFYQKYFVRTGEYGKYQRGHVNRMYVRYCIHNNFKMLGLKNFYEAFRKNENVTEKKSGEDYFVISEPNE